MMNPWLMLGCSIHEATLWKNLLYITTACRGEGNFKCIPQESKHEDIIPKYIDAESWRYHSDVPGYDVKSNITSIYGISMIKTIQSDIIQISFRCPKFLDAVRPWTAWCWSVGPTSPTGSGSPSNELEKIPSSVRIGTVTIWWNDIHSHGKIHHAINR